MAYINHKYLPALKSVNNVAEILQSVIREYAHVLKVLLSLALKLPGMCIVPLTPRRHLDTQFMMNRQGYGFQGLQLENQEVGTTQFPKLYCQ